MSEAGIVPAPPGETADFSHFGHVSGRILALFLTGAIVVSLFVAIRIYTRLYLLKSFHWDDTSLLLAWACVVAYCGIGIETGKHGFDRHTWDIPASEAVNAFKWQWIISLMYNPAILSVKWAFFASLFRIFGRYRSAVWLIGFGFFGVTAIYISIFFRALFYCDPIERVYNPSIPGSCYSTETVGYISAAFNIATDFYILILPMPYTWSLQMRSGNRLKIMSVFGLGIFCCACSIVRIALLGPGLRSTDPFREEFALLVWSSLEIFVGTVCVSAMVLPSFMKLGIVPGMSSLMSGSRRWLGLSTTRTKSNASAMELGDTSDSGMSAHGDPAHDESFDNHAISKRISVVEFEEYGQPTALNPTNTKPAEHPDSKQLDI